MPDNTINPKAPGTSSTLRAQAASTQGLAAPCVGNATRPDLVLRLGLAGNRWGGSADDPDTSPLRPEPSGVAALEAATAAVFDEVERQLLQIATDKTHDARGSRVAGFYSQNPPVLRLITGLAEGADQLAATALSRRASDGSPVRRELAGVVPCTLAAYRESRKPWHRADFDAAVASCAYVLELDGSCEKPVPDTPLAATRRARAYRAQAAFLLRQCDLLVAIADLSAAGSAGGTLETITRAMDFQIPVVLIDARSAKPHLLQPGDDIAEVLGRTVRVDWREQLRHWVLLLAAGPDMKEKHPGGSPDAHKNATHATSRDDALLKEFFEEFPWRRKGASPDRLPTFRERIWKRFSDHFHTDESLQQSGAAADKKLEPYAAWRQRATALNYHYAGLYRGTFVLNYGLAVVAVAFATLSLVLFAMWHDRGHALTWTLFGLALVKLACIGTIYNNTHRANHNDWNNKAIDYRYLSERLRCAYYLPIIGSLRPPVPAKAQFTSRAMRQSAVDWLFESMMRHVSPLQIDRLVGGAGESERVLRVDPVPALQTMRDHWIRVQQEYHQRNAAHMEQMHKRMQAWGTRLNVTVIGAVLVDLVFVLLILSDRLPHELAEVLHACTPLLIGVAAVIPAAVASLSGIRFQSECQRLAERSNAMEDLLKSDADRAAKLSVEMNQARMNAEVDLGSWAADVLRLAEGCARKLVEEATEWSVLYAKELHEP